MTTNPNPIIRGKHVLPHQSQILARDLHGEDIMNKRGLTCFCYCLSDAEVEKVRKNGPGLPYKYLLYSPGNAAFNWTAFYTRENLNDFCAASVDLIRDTVPALLSDKDVASLFIELTRVGYFLKVITRFNRNHRIERQKQII